MEKIVRAMMDLIASEVCGKELDQTQFQLSDEELAGLYRLSKFHDLAHLVGDALIKNDLIPEGELKAKFEKQLMMAVYRYERINYELTQIKQTLNDAKIPFLPLKGSVLRRYYPEPWMRTSCDIDVLVREEMVDFAAKTIVAKIGYTYEKKNYHDISLMAQSGVHLELHYSIKECKENIDRLLSKSWDFAAVSNEYEYQFDHAYFFFHQIAHASYHFLSGGCGVRPFLDIYLLKQQLDFDQRKLDELLLNTGIQKFYEYAMQLANVWFGDGVHNDTTLRMEHYVLMGGIYGNTENYIAVKQQSEKGRLGYILHRIWVPYELLCGTYPQLRGRRFLQPVYEIRRWFRMLNPEVRKRKKNDLTAIRQLSAEKKNEVNHMLNELGLS